MDFFTHWYNIARLLTVAFSISAIYLSTARAIPLWEQYTSIDKDFWWAFNAACVLFIEGSIEQMISDTPAGPRTVFSVMVAMVFSRAARRRRHSSDKRIS